MQSSSCVVLHYFHVTSVLHVMCCFVFFYVLLGFFSTFHVVVKEASPSAIVGVIRTARVLRKHTHWSQYIQAVVHGTQQSPSWTSQFYQKVEEIMLQSSYRPCSSVLRQKQF